MKGWTYVRTIFSKPKFSGCIDNQILLSVVPAAKSSSIIGYFVYMHWYFCGFKVGLLDGVNF